MNTMLRVTSLIAVLTTFLCSGCDETATSKTLPTASLVRLHDIPSGILLPSDFHQESADDLQHSLEFIQSTFPAETTGNTEPVYHVGDMYGDGQEYLAMMSIEEESPSMDHTYADPTTSEQYKAMMDEEVLENPHDFDGIYSWAGPEVEGYEEVLKSLPKEDPTHKTPAQREAERLLVEPDVTEQYLAYHRHNTSGPRNGNRKASKTKDDQVQERLPNIQEYIRAKRRGSLHENKES